MIYLNVKEITKDFGKYLFNKGRGEGGDGILKRRRMGGGGGGGGGGVVSNCLVLKSGAIFCV